MKYEGVTILCHSIGELEDTVRNLSMDGFRIITVLETMRTIYAVVAQKEIP